MISRWLVFAYALAAYIAAARVMVYLVLFVSNLYVSRSIDSGTADRDPAWALVWDAGLLAAFGLTHSVMARGWFKDQVLARCPRPVERSTYVLVSAAMLALVMAAWRPATAIVWSATWRPAEVVLAGVSAAGWMLALVSSHTLGHFDLYGVAPAWRYARERDEPAPPLKTDRLYGAVRHPMYLGFLAGVWSTPRMSAGHLVFSAAMTAYLIVGMWFEERDLARRYGATYASYRERVARMHPLRRLRGSSGFDRLENPP